MSVSIGEACVGCAACARACPVGAIGGERKRRHAVDDSRCIECEACGRVCPQGAVSDHRGSPIARLTPRARWPKPAFSLGRCISCGVCAEKCPVSCIALSEGEPGGRGAMPALAAPERCVSCGLCAFYCPMGCVEVRAAADAEEAR